VSELPSQIIREAAAIHTSLIEQSISVTQNRQRDGVRKFAVRPLTLSRTTLEDLPIFEESLRAKIIVECPISIRNKAKRRAA
jgi:hypothetical protein